MKITFPIYLIFAFCAVTPLTTLAEEVSGEGNILIELSSDKERLRDVHQIARLIEAYHVKTGFYPGTKDWDVSKYGRLFVRISDKDLPGDFFTISARARPSYTSNQLLDDLKKGLGNDVELPYDRRPIKKPSAFCPTYYSYSWNGQCYYVTAYMDFQYKQTNIIGPECYAYRVSSCEVVSEKVRKFKDIDPEEKLIPLTEEQN